MRVRLVISEIPDSHERRLSEGYRVGFTDGITTASCAIAAFTPTESPWSRKGRGHAMHWRFDPCVSRSSPSRVGWGIRLMSSSSEGRSMRELIDRQGTSSESPDGGTSFIWPSRNDGFITLLAISMEVTSLFVRIRSDFRRPINSMRAGSARIDPEVSPTFWKSAMRASKFSMRAMEAGLFRSASIIILRTSLFFT